MATSAKIIGYAIMTGSQYEPHRIDRWRVVPVTSISSKRVYSVCPSYGSCQDSIRELVAFRETKEEIDALFNLINNFCTIEKRDVIAAEKELDRAKAAMSKQAANYFEKTEPRTSKRVPDLSNLSDAELKAVLAKRKAGSAK